MHASDVMHKLATVIDEHAWHELPSLLHEDFTCRYVHTGQRFDAPSWVRFNAEYPGFQRFVLEDCVGTEDRAVGRAHVTGMTDGELQHFEVATFLTVRDDLIIDMTEVWADVINPA
ncbi:nuclear transport factor 2 family protein [Tenggerimyces flavus]|uniref:Nuclear transport factor 2 family protein n=1 Tax=Tenggerimyces flavus TaxID=1708749 RepID=A0ABV7Y715_9ACTN|nr:nuclear transport factor 2 family protein [Tenggerimyces flavus]MBM7785268.1 ketosteroid isomerase-like protein [Tenggerimyces flavus]